jgi:GR25 family glycosyltransferase involved in LPS biosynthesis
MRLYKVCIFLIALVLVVTFFYKAVSACKEYFEKTDYFGKVIVINLDSRPDRLQDVQKQLDYAGIEFERFSALSGKDHHCRFKRFSSGTVGCSLSHRAVWQKLLDDKSSNWYLVFEDDIFIPPEITKKTFNDIMDGVLSDFPETEFVAFGHCGCDGSEKEAYDKNKHTIIPGYNACAHAYAINRKGAQRLLSQDYICQYPIDLYIGGMYRFSPTKIFRVISSIKRKDKFGEGIVFQDRKSSSDIENRDSQGLMKCLDQ